MPTILSFEHIKLTLNGHTFQGWANEDPPVEFPDIEFLETDWGKDGTLYASNTAIRGGEVMVKLLPSSRSTKKVLNWVSERQRGKRLSFKGTFSDPELGFTVTLRGGLLTQAAAAAVPDKTYEATFTFEEILPNYNTAQFDPKPASTSGA